MPRNPYNPDIGLVAEITEADAKLSKRERRQRALTSPATYLEYLVYSQAMQRRYIAEEQKRNAKLRKAWDAYAAKAHALGFHPLTGAEIADRASELQHMLARVAETHGDSLAQRALWEARQAEGK